MENQRCHPSCSINNSTQRPGESVESPTSNTSAAATSDQHHSTQKSTKRHREIDSTTNASRLSPSKRLKIAPPPPPPPTFNFTSLPPEIRLMILHHALTPAAGPNATISTHPRSKILPDPPAETWMAPVYGPQRTQWHARRGLLQASSGLRAETLQVLYASFGFFARMPMGWEFDGKRRFSRWLKAFGGSEEEGVEMVRRVVFRVEWPAVRRSGGMEWFKGRTEVEVCVLGGKGRVRARLDVVPTMWAQKQEAPWLVLEDVEEMVDGFLEAKGGGVVGLGRKEWMEVWLKVKEVMRLQDFD